MTMAWYSEIYQKTAIIVLGIIFFAGLIVYRYRKTSPYFIVAWASIKSWIIVAPILFILFGLPDPWPLVFFSFIAIAGAKVFFQIMGMYSMTSFVTTCYLGILGLALCCWYDNLAMYNNMPMIVLGCSFMVPILSNSYRKMIQYISITLLGFIFLGWSFLHLGLIWKLPNGMYQVMYLIILTEFCDNTILALSGTMGGRKIFRNINPKRTLPATLVSVGATMLLALGMRYLLPDSNEKYWLASGLVASLGGMFGDLVMTVIRRDAGVRIVGQFIAGRGDFLNRMDRLIFVAPLYYYTMLLIQKTGW